MAENKKSYSTIETLIGIFTVDKSTIKILLMRKKTEPYKGYWILPGDILPNNQTLEQSIVDVTYNKLGLPNLYMEQCHNFSSLERDPSERLIACTFLGLIDNITLYLKKEERQVEYEWFDIRQIPKTGYDHNIIVEKLVSSLKTKIVSSNILKKLFPSDFTLPELKQVYEQILGISLDRRNFRKKLINLGYIEDTGDINEGCAGRPAKLYRFREDLKERNLF